MSENTILQNEENVIIVTFNITEANIINSNNTITLKNLTGMTEIDWGDLNDSATGLSHTYSVVGEYTCKIYGCTSIGSFAFRGSSKLTSVVIPDSVTSIGYEAFKDCHSLTSVVIGDGVTSIGEGAFSYCLSLTNINIPDSVTSIGNYAFFDCGSLTSVVIPDGVTKINDYAFSSCDSLTSVVIGDSVTSIGKYAFESCKNLISITIPKNIISIEDSFPSFRSCYRLVEVINNSTHITVEKGSRDNGYLGYYALSVSNRDDSYVSKLSNDNGYIVYTDEEEKILVGCSENENDLKIPNYVTKINQYAFYFCTNLTSVVIGNSVTSIGREVFYACRNITSIVISESVTSIGEDAFYGCSSLTSVTFKSINPLDTSTLQSSKINRSNSIYYVPTEAVETYQTAWAGVVDPSKILPFPEDNYLISLYGLRTYHNTLKEKHLDVLQDNVDAFRNEIPNNNNIENGIGTGAIQQIPDNVADGFDFTNKNPNATILDPSLTGTIPYGATGDFACAFGGKSAAQGKRSHAEGTTTIAKGDYSHSEGNNSVALGANSHAEGKWATSYGENSHAEGFNTVSQGNLSHSEGDYTVAEGLSSHAEGSYTHAKGYGSHSEGVQTQAIGDQAHAEGFNTMAEGHYSHAGGRYTEAKYIDQTVIGRYNYNKIDTLFEIGCGAENDRKNAFEVYKDGSVFVKDKIKGENYNTTRYSYLNLHNGIELGDSSYGKILKAVFNNSSEDGLQFNPHGEDFDKYIFPENAKFNKTYVIATEEYVDDLVGNINTALEAILGV